MIAQKCRQLTATDFSEKMLKKAEKNCRAFRNITYDQADITALLKEFKGLAHAELVMMFPERFANEVKRYLEE